MTRKKWLIAALVVNLCLISLTVWWYHYETPLSLTCQGNLSFNDHRQDNNFNFEGLVAMHFHEDGTGFFNLYGDVSSKQSQWEVSRQETFAWRLIHDSLYELSITGIERFGHDTLPTGIFEKYVAGITLGKKRLLTLQRTPDNALIISTTSSPLLVCAG